MFSAKFYSFFPREIYFPSWGETWCAVYKKVPGNCVSARSFVEAGKNTLLVQLDNEAQRDMCAKLLKKWLCQRGKMLLGQRLLELAAVHGFSVNRITVKDVTSRWGSCSVLNNINLNLRLLFLGDDLINYVLLHELCHIRHHDHSQNFWRSLEELHPGCKLSRENLKKAGDLIPKWAL